MVAFGMDGTIASSAPANLDRHRWTIDDVSSMIENGQLDAYKSLELIGGELIEMPAEGALHSDVKSKLILHVAAAAFGRYAIGADTPLRLSDHNCPEPDLFIIPNGMRPSSARGSDALLVVEVSDSTVLYDLGGKADLYAHYGVREYWVINLDRSTIQVHHLQLDGTYDASSEIDLAIPLSPRLAPEISIRLADLL